MKNVKKESFECQQSQWNVSEKKKMKVGSEWGIKNSKKLKSKVFGLFVFTLRFLLCRAIFLDYYVARTFFGDCAFQDYTF